MEDYILRLEGVKRDFKRQSEIIHAVQGVDMLVKRGTFNILCGRSGSGKTTLLNMIAAVDLPTEGKIYYKDKDITSMSSSQRDDLRRVEYGIIFQNTALIAQMSAVENVEFALSIAGVKASQRNEQAVKWLEKMGIKERRNHMPAEMSGGEQARVAIGRGLAHEPSLLLADEPTSELDTLTSFRVIDMFKDLVKSKGLTIIMTTHDVNIMDAADYIYTMEDGVIIDVR